MSLDTLGASLLGNLLTVNGTIAKRQGRGIVIAGYGAKKQVMDKKKSDSMSSLNKL